MIAEVIKIEDEFRLCEICDNYTPRVEVVSDEYTEVGCLYCWEAYGEIN